MDFNRRRFLKGSAVLGASPLMAVGRMAQERQKSQRVVPGTVLKRQLGRTGVEVSALGLGGYHLGSAETDQAANEGGAIGQRFKREAAGSFRDDQGVHPRSRQESRSVNARGILAQIANRSPGSVADP
jgi:hypothetical protein